jgi:hypothetical protein
MSSSLTRSIFRRLVRGQPIRYHGCLNRPLLRPQYCQQPTLPIQRRQIFGFGAGFQRPSGSTRKEQSIRHHLDVLLNTSKQLNLNIRTPPPDFLAKAWVTFFAECKESREMVTDYHTKASLDVWKFLQETEGVVPMIKPEDVGTALTAIANYDYGSRKPKNWNIYKKVFRNPHQEPFDTSYIELASRLAEFILVDIQTDVSPMRLLLQCHANAGYPEMALEILLSQPSQISDSLNWTLVISAAKGSMPAMIQVVEAIKNNKEHIPINEIRAVLFQALVETSWFDSVDGLSSEIDTSWVDGVLSDPNPDLESVNHMIRTAVLFSWPEKEKTANMVENSISFLRESSEMKLTEQEYTSILKKLYDSKLALTLSMQYDFTSLTPILEEMSTADIAIDEHTLSLLLQTALVQHDTDLAADLESWAEENRIRGRRVAVASEYVKYFLAEGDLQSAMPHYLVLESPDIEEVPEVLMNQIEEQLLKELCIVTPLDEVPLERLHDILERQPSGKRWMPETLAALTYFSLRSEDYEEVVELLRRHLPYFTLADRQKITNEIIAFSFRPSTSPDAQWNSYVLLTAINATVDRETLCRYMNAFIKADFEEEALEAFSQMRNSPKPELRPDASVYIAALNGIGTLGDMKAVQSIHNHLKLDTKVDPNVPLWTALVIAYTNCNEPRYALTLWDQILDMDSGPDEESVLAALNASKISPGGTVDVLRVWSPVVERGIEITPSMFSSYVATLYSTGNIDQAKTEIEVNSGKYDQISR